MSLLPSYRQSTVLPDGRRIFIGDTVTGSYWAHNDVRGTVIGWTAGVFTVDIEAASSIELRPENILTVEAAQ
uniref:hypothetical protein n=1 Tax=Paractinoplanes polyasparticus TaxID=2856853 RepID=UPI001C843733|nr:hypothetical protein [Actinoplanes polyasparticus]